MSLQGFKYILTVTYKVTKYCVVKLFRKADPSLKIKFLCGLS